MGRAFGAEVLAMLGVGGIVSESSLAFGALSCRDDMDSPVGTVFVSGLQPLNVFFGWVPRASP
jgi:hypothetical protein